jgi:hypothetical protein
MGLTENTATALLALNGLDIRPDSAVSVEHAEVGLAGSGQRLAVLGPSGSRVLSDFDGESSAASGSKLVLGPMNATNLNALRDLLPWLRPRPLGTPALWTKRKHPTWRASSPAGSQREPVGKT